MQLSDFDFDLPQQLIAKRPLLDRSSSKLMCLSETAPGISHHHFYNLVDFIEPGDVLVFNNTKVIKARLFGHKTTGGKVEVLIERIIDDHHALAQLCVSKSPKIGDEIIFANNIRLQVKARHQHFYELYCGRALSQVIDTIGHIPLPHYMHRAAEADDVERYQTVYAKHNGSVAAPTAGLHFDEALLQKLRAKQVEMAYLTLHIGAGTFAPVRVNNIAEHKMHTESLTVPDDVCDKINIAKARGKRVIAVGTTSMRALETAARAGQDKISPYHGETQIFIYPGYQFKCVDALITNFHLPRSSLLMLVCAFGGVSQVINAYKLAVAESYRFYSYGDAMWLNNKR